MARNLGLVWLPEINNLPGCSPRNFETLRREAAWLDWVEVEDKEAFLARLPEAEAALVWFFRPEYADCATKLRLVATPAAGHDLASLRPDSEIEISYGTFHGKFMAETVLGMMLAFCRGIYDCAVSDALWPRAEMNARIVHLRGSHAAILGFGHIGKAVGGLLKAFGVRVTGVNRNNFERPGYFDAGDRVAALPDLDAILPEVDHLVLVLPGTPENTDIIDARRLALLRSSAFIYNIGRGNAIHLPALADALEAGRLAGAGLDVFPREPLPADSPILGCPRVIRLPHISAFGPGYMDAFFEELLPRLERLRRSAGQE